MICRLDWSSLLRLALFSARYALKPKKDFFLQTYHTLCEIRAEAKETLKIIAEHGCRKRRVSTLKIYPFYIFALTVSQYFKYIPE
jgi:hypothetical protein